jgi:hypothetical protein
MQGLKYRFTQLNVADPDMVIADNCCHIQSAITPVFPTTQIGLDVWHFKQR